MKIEDLYKRHLQGREAAPPSDAWDKISNRLAAQGRRAALRRRWLPWMGALAMAIALAAALWHPHKPSAAKEGAPLAKTATQRVQEHPKAALRPASAEKAEVSPSCLEAMPCAKRGVLPSAPADTEPETYRAVLPESLPQRKLRLAEAEPAMETENEKYATEYVDTASIVSWQEESGADVARPAPAPPTRIAIPNVVTPNGDGINDTWRLDVLNDFAPVKVQIYTARGRLVFSSSNYDGSFSGSDLPDGNYFYVIQLGAQNQTRRGVLVIKR
ncbi:MAG: gliding motility-associated C-terminal domain-containing protein [Bacteroidales bacterium]|nr:gliding motility-associated C-terminal domain-containing protein [Bacteroidales bacterium]